MNSRLLCKLLLISLLLVLASCHDRGTNPSSPTPEGQHLSGKVINWIMGDTMVAVAKYQLFPYTSAESIYVFGTSAIDKDGNFGVPLATPPQELLQRVFAINFTLSDTAAKFLTIYELGLRKPDHTYLFGGLENASVPFETYYSDSSKPGDYVAYFVYADRDVEVTGTRSVNVPSVQSVHIQYHLSYKKGWNRIVETIVSNQALHMELEATVVNVNAGNWYMP